MRQSKRDHEIKLQSHDSELFNPKPRTRPSLEKNPHSYASSNSSDAPFFSSDDLAEASLDNYGELRQPKRKHKGTWWKLDDVSHKTSSLTTRSTKRSLDSGVFMGSDSGSSSSTDDGFSINNILTTKRHCYRSDLHRRNYGSISDNIVTQAVNSCIEEGTEIIDLSNCSLKELSNESLQPLHYLIRRPRFDVATCSKEAVYHTLTPSLKIFLASNSLTAIPSEMLSLDNLTVLSLRNNHITDLPSSIGKLRNLVELNVAGNQLRWLPWEVLQLVRGKLVNFNIFPNPLLQFTSKLTDGISIYDFPVTVEASKKRLDSLEKSVGDATPHGKWILQLQRELHERLICFTEKDFSIPGLSTSQSAQLPERLNWKKDPVYLGSSELAYLDLNGYSTRRSRPPPSSISSDIDVLPPSEPKHMKDDSARQNSHHTLQLNPAQGGPSRVHSLFELALRACSKQKIIDESMDNIDIDLFPPSVQRAFASASAARQEGGRSCSICTREYIQPRVEWIEYWHCAPDALHCAVHELFIPFLRRSCSWSCIP